MNSPVSAPEELWLRSRFAEPRTVEPVTSGDGHLWQRDREIRPAAVLVPLVKRESGVTVLFTRRTAHVNHQRNSVVHEGRERRYYAIPYRQYYIWGATAGMLMNLHSFLKG